MILRGHGDPFRGVQFLYRSDMQVASALGHWLRDCDARIDLPGADLSTPGCGRRLPRGVVTWKDRPVPRCDRSSNAVRLSRRGSRRSLSRANDAGRNGPRLGSPPACGGDPASGLCDVADEDRATRPICCARRRAARFPFRYPLSGGSTRVGDVAKRPTAGECRSARPQPARVGPNRLAVGQSDARHIGPLAVGRCDGSYCLPGGAATVLDHRDVGSKPRIGLTAGVEVLGLEALKNRPGRFNPGTPGACWMVLVGTWRLRFRRCVRLIYRVRLQLLCSGQWLT